MLAILFGQPYLAILKQSLKRLMTFYRQQHPLAAHLIELATSRHLPPATLNFQYGKYGSIISVLESLLGQSGWLELSKLTITSLDTGRLRISRCGNALACCRSLFTNRFKIVDISELENKCNGQRSRSLPILRKAANGAEKTLLDFLGSPKDPARNFERKSTYRERLATSTTSNSTGWSAN